jgi:HSP20 family molecular chaperone IbpA
MFNSTSINTVGNCLVDWYYRPSYTGDFFTPNYPFDYPSHYNFTPIWNTIILELPKKVKETDYPNYPKCRHTITESGNTILEFACAGFNKKEISMEVQDDQIIIRGKKEDETKEKKEKVIFSSLSQKSFEVSFDVSDKKFDTNSISSSFENGMLIVTIPLSEDIKKKNRKIEIK